VRGGSDSIAGIADADRPSVRGTPSSARGSLAGISDALVSLFFPAGCLICNELLRSASRVPICKACLGSFVCHAATRLGRLRTASDRADA